jgi:hypothetical protein
MMFALVDLHIRLLKSQQFDSNLSKNFALVDGSHLQIRMEAFNVLNHPLWVESSDGWIQNSTLGTIERGTWGQSNQSPDADFSQSHLVND